MCIKNLNGKPKQINITQNYLGETTAVFWITYEHKIF